MYAPPCGWTAKHAFQLAALDRRLTWLSARAPTPPLNKKTRAVATSRFSGLGPTGHIDKVVRTQGNAHTRRSATTSGVLSFRGLPGLAPASTVASRLSSGASGTEGFAVQTQGGAYARWCTHKAVYGLATLDRRLASLDAGSNPRTPPTQRDSRFHTALWVHRLVYAPPCVCIHLLRFSLLRSLDTSLGMTRGLAPAPPEIQEYCGGPKSPSISTALCVHRLVCRPPTLLYPPLTSLPPKPTPYTTSVTTLVPPG